MIESICNQAPRWRDDYRIELPRQEKEETEAQEQCHAPNGAAEPGVWETQDFRRRGKDRYINNHLCRGYGINRKCDRTECMIDNFRLLGVS
jgi:hypothetical protein